jgi:beta-lactamase class A
MAIIRRRALSLSLAGGLAACARPQPKLLKGRSARFETAGLDKGFPALADRARPGVFALGAMSLETTKTWYWNTDRAFPLAGAAALPIAAAALSEVDAGRLSLGERVRLGPMELSPPPSLLNQKWPSPVADHVLSAPVEALIKLALCGDNTAQDVLMGRIGGPGAVTAWLQQQGVTEMRIDRYQRQLLSDQCALPSFRPEWKDSAAFFAARDQIGPPLREVALNAYAADHRDTATAEGALDFLSKLANGELISQASVARLLAWMSAAGGGYLRRGLPKDVFVASASGTSPTDLGVTPAMSELAIAAFPGGRRYALAAFLVASTGSAVDRDGLFRDAARLADQAIG